MCIRDRVGQPEFGSKLRELCFEQIDDNLPERIEEEVRSVISVWLPYISITEVQTLTEEGDENKIFVKITYATSLTPQTQEQITLDASYTATVY